MKKSIYMAVGVFALTASALLVWAYRQKSTHYRIARSADEGYETAHDILYPGKRIYSSRLRYGPVLPKSRLSN